jgi:hypothetical protein
MTTCRDAFVTLMKVVSHRGGDHLPSDATPEAGTGEGALIRRYRTRPRPRKSEWKLTDALSDVDDCGPVHRRTDLRRDRRGTSLEVMHASSEKWYEHGLDLDAHIDDLWYGGERHDVAPHLDERG